MKILKIFGIVVGIHIFALILIFANPGCSSTTKAPPTPADTVAKPEPNSAVSVPSIAAAPASQTAPVTFNPDAAAPASTGGASSGVRFVPTRPGTPVAGTLVNEPVTDVTPATTYTVVSGDNLSKIAKKTHTTTAELAAANSLKINATLRPGQKLMIPGKAAAPSAPASNGLAASMPAPKSVEPAATRAPGDVLKHTVKSGETLGAIAKKYDVRVADIAVANNISDPAKIRPGMELIIPGWDKPAGKAAKNGKTPASSQKSGDTKAALPEQPAVTPPAPTTATPIVPIIPVEDSPLKPAPRP